MAVREHHDALDRESGAGALILGLIVGLALMGIVYLIFFAGAPAGGTGSVAPQPQLVAPAAP